MLKSKLYNGLLLFTFFSFTSGIRITSQLFLYVFLSAVLLSVHLIAIAFGGTRLMLPTKGYANIFVLLFFFIAFITMLVRGIGFEFLGSNKSGGMFYVQLFAILLLYVFSIKAKVSDRFVTILFASYFIASALPFLADVLFLLNGGETPLNLIIPGSSTISFYAESEEALLRIQSAASFAEYLAVVMLAFVPVFDEKGNITLNKWNVAIMLFCLILIGLSGHRITFIGIAILLFVYYKSRFGSRKLIKPIVIGGVVALVICALAIASFNQLPASFQRAFSFLPFTPTNTTTLDAGDSLNFRVLMAAKAMVMAPDYLLIGKGFAFVNYPVDLTDFFGIIDFFAEIGVFHNGVIGLLVNLGVFGLIVGLLLIFSLPRAAGKYESTQSLSRLENIRLILKCKIVVSIVYFLFLYGDVQTNFIELIVVGLLYKFVGFHIAEKQRALMLRHESTV